MSEKIGLTPLMRQYLDIKQYHVDTLLLFQVGDFYELFFDDAKQAASFLGIALTKRGTCNGEPIPLCGVPVHALDFYLTKLIKGGFKVALCDQLEPPTPGQLVARGVTQVLTPGTLTSSTLLEEKSASYLLSFFPIANSWALVFGELMTAQLFATTISGRALRQLETELSRFFPAEIVVPQVSSTKHFQAYFKQLGYFTTLDHTDIHDSSLTAHVAGWLKQQFSEDNYQEVLRQEPLRLALTTFYSYIQRNQRSALEHFRHINLYRPDDFLLLDSATQRNLELIKNMHDGGSKNTLYAHMDKAITAMGSRMLKKWLVRPLIKQEAIEQRFDVVGTLVQNKLIRSQLEECLGSIADIERVVGRIALGKALLPDYIALMQALIVVPHVKTILIPHQHLVVIRVILDHIGDFAVLCELLEASLHTTSAQTGLIKQGFDQQLDHLRELAHNSDQKILMLERKEQEATNITSLKIRYNHVQGYYLEVTKLGARSVPDYFIRQQTLAGKERFTTHELRALHDEITRARYEVDAVEKQVFERIKFEVVRYLVPLRKMAHGLAYLDALLGLSRCAYEHGYVRPTFTAGRDIFIEDGRHPVVEASTVRFIPNSTDLSNNACFWIITGPNMGGKSTYLRQVALMCLMAQCGSFVPAKRAVFTLLDRIFTRIGAGDNLAEGKSTFLIEMEETAMICTQATPQSLVILDEVGRGTSTFDGLAIAQAVVEHIYTNIRARCLFATHYHELTKLQENHPGIKSYYAASKKTPDGIVFLYKMMPGIADGSFGIEVARLAQLPGPLLSRAQHILQDLKSNGNFAQVAHSRADEQRIKDLQQELEIIKQKLSLIVNIDYNELSPKKAFDVLWQFKEKESL
jgi:DNA mismatch repair protein MutS